MAKAINQYAIENIQLFMNLILKNSVYMRIDGVFVEKFVYFFEKAKNWIYTTS